MPRDGAVRRLPKKIPGEGDVIERRRELTRQRRAVLVEYARQRSCDGHPLHRADVIAQLGASASAADHLLRQLEREGILVRLSHFDGWVHRDATPGSRSVTNLSDALALARRCADATMQARRGRQSLEASRDVRAITTGQLADIERLVRLALSHHPEAGGDASALGSQWLVWDNALAHGRGDWRLAERAEIWARAEHQSKHEARLAGRPDRMRPVWTPELAIDTVRDYQGAARVLCYLAATHGLIGRSPVQNQDAGFRFAPAFAGPLSRWNRHLRRRDDVRTGNRARLWIGLRRLAITATELGATTWRTADWVGVRRHIEHGASHGAISVSARDDARYAWRAVVTALRARGVSLDERHTWSVSTDDAITLVTQSAIRDAAGRGDFSGWQMRDGQVPSGLLDGPYGLRAWQQWSTLPEHLLRRQEPPLPPRVWADEPSKGKRRRKHRTPMQTRTSTVSTRLDLFAHLAGWAARSRGIDWTTADLRVLADPELVDAYFVAMVGAGEERRARTRQLVLTVAWLVNGYLFAQAQLKENTALVTTFRDWYRKLESIADECPSPKGLDWAEVRNHTNAVAEAWRGADRQEGLWKIARLGYLLLRKLCELADGRSIEQQRTALQCGTWSPSLRWARCVRLVIVLTVLVRVPLRRGTVSVLREANWRAAPVGGEQTARAARGCFAQHEGALGLVIDGEHMKAGRAFSPAIILARNVGEAAFENALQREAIALWFMPGGGRDICCTAGGVRHSVPWLFPDPKGTAMQWGPTAISSAFRSSLLRHAAALGLVPNALRTLRGASGIHVIRKLFGTYWAPKNLVYCSRLLDHASIAFTAAIYCAQDEREMSLDIAAADQVARAAA